MGAITLGRAFYDTLIPSVFWARRKDVRRRAREMREKYSFTRSFRWVGGNDDAWWSAHPAQALRAGECRFDRMTAHTEKPKRPMASRLIERGLRVRILTGFSLVILLTIAIASWSIYHISTLSTAAEHLFIENYRSVGYMHAMESAITGMEEGGSQTMGTNDALLRKNLALEYKNITELGELEAAMKIESDYAAYYAHPSKALASNVQNDCEVVLRMNERAMFSRSEAFKAQGNFARSSTIIITLLLVGAAIFLAVAVSRRSLAEFQELDRAKSNFVATAAHELKNPLAAIKTTSGLLADGIAGPLAQKQIAMVTSIRTETNRLLNLVRELLDLAKLETGTLLLQQTSTEVETIIEDAVMPVTLKAEEANISIDIAASKGLPKIFVDPNKMAWAIGNLLSNAIRYSPRGSSVVVTASAIENEIWISVTDKGKGIAESNLARIFDKFVQVEDGAMGGGSGSGLGLSIAREIVQAHDGRIWATSSIGHGSTFTIALPLDERSFG